jgi:hypothetical protein
MLKKKSMDSFLREATVLRSVNYLKHSGKLEFIHRAASYSNLSLKPKLISHLIGFPQMLMSAYNEDICILVEDLLGMNLETLRKRFGRLSLAVVCSIGIQLV